MPDVLWLQWRGEVDIPAASELAVLPSVTQGCLPRTKN